MLKDITFGQYYEGRSVIHKTDPRVKILLMILFIVFIFDFYNKYMSKMLFTQHLQLLTQYSQIQVFHSMLICE